jgi:hypothetical protein
MDARELATPIKSLRDVLTYVARHVPAHPHDLAEMERVIGEHFPDPAPAPDPEPTSSSTEPATEPASSSTEPATEPASSSTEHVVDAAEYAQFLAWQADQAATPGSPPGLAAWQPAPGPVPPDGAAGQDLPGG